MHAVVKEVLSSSSTDQPDWILAISHFLASHGDLVQTKVHTVSTQVEVIVTDIKNRNIIRKLELINIWKFSSEEAIIFAEKLNKCVEDNLM